MLLIRLAHGYSCSGIAHMNYTKVAESEQDPTRNLAGATCRVRHLRNVESARLSASAASPQAPPALRIQRSSGPGTYSRGPTSRNQHGRPILDESREHRLRVWRLLNAWADDVTRWVGTVS